ncbi:MAG: hypothetical protein ACLP5H_32220 [Desulfomonilaceae bacterium]
MSRPWQSSCAWRISFDQVNPEALKKQYEILGVHVNGPKLWMLDWIDVPVGTERDFNGLRARWVSLLDLTTSHGGNFGVACQ